MRLAERYRIDDEAFGKVAMSGQRPAEPGECCTCGRPAVLVFTGGSFGDVGYCGLDDGGEQDGTCPFCRGDRHGNAGRCPEYRLRPVSSSSPISPPPPEWRAER